MGVVFVCDEKNSLGGGLRGPAAIHLVNWFVRMNIDLYPSRMIQLQLVNTSPIGTLVPWRGENVSLR